MEKEGPKKMSDEWIRMQNEIKELKDFKTIDFPENMGVVYVVFYRLKYGDIPLYVGETNRLQGRIGDYISADFKAPTNFKVGEAIKYLQKRGYRVIIRYKPSEDRKREQNELIKYFQGSGCYRLLNELIGYDPKKTDENEERKRIRKFLLNNFANI